LKRFSFATSQWNDAPGEASHQREASRSASSPGRRHDGCRSRWSARSIAGNEHVDRALTGGRRESGTQTVGRGAAQIAQGRGLQGHSLEALIAVNMVHLCYYGAVVLLGKRYSAQAHPPTDAVTPYLVLTLHALPLVCSCVRRRWLLLRVL